MWHWFTVNSIWFLTGAAVIFILTVVGRNSYRDRIAKLKPEQKNAKRNRIFNHILLAIIYASIAVMMASFVGIVSSS